MADETTGTGTGETNPSEVPAETTAAPAAQSQTTGATGTPPAASPGPDAVALTEQERNRIAADARREADAKAKAAAKELAAANEELAAYKAAEQALKDANLSEVERANKAATDAAARAQAAEDRAAASELGRTRADLIASDPAAAVLPIAYKNLVVGTDTDSLQTSLAAALAQFETDKAAILATVPAPVPAKPASLATVGNPAGSQGTPLPDEYDPLRPETWSDPAYRKYRTKHGIGAPIMGAPPTPQP